MTQSSAVVYWYREVVVGTHTVVVVAGATQMHKLEHRLAPVGVVEAAVEAWGLLGHQVLDLVSAPEGYPLLVQTQTLCR